MRQARDAAGRVPRRPRYNPPIRGSQLDSRERFTAIVSGPDAGIGLAEASLLVACEEYPELDVPAYLGRLDELAVDLKQRVAPGNGPEAVVGELNGLLFERLGFRGNDDDYYDPRNSYLNEVLDRRTGIPITLSMVYIEVGRRAGFEVHGVGLPGHFLVRVEGERYDLLVDAFNRGALMSVDDCRRRLDRIFGGKLRFESTMLGPCRRRDMLARMLRNLKVIHIKAGDVARALGVVDLLVRLEPEDRDEVKDRGLLYAALDCYGLALRDLEEYLARGASGPWADQILAKVAELRHRAERVN